jgi:hypothetical protein
MPGESGCNRGDHARVLCFISHARLRVRRAPGIPHALYRAEVHAQLGRIRVAGCGCVCTRYSSSLRTQGPITTGFRGYGRYPPSCPSREYTAYGSRLALRLAGTTLWLRVVCEEQIDEASTNTLFVVPAWCTIAHAAQGPITTGFRGYGRYPPSCSSREHTAYGSRLALRLAGTTKRRPALPRSPRFPLALATVPTNANSALAARVCLKVRNSNWRSVISLCITRPFATSDKWRFLFRS